MTKANHQALLKIQSVADTLDAWSESAQRIARSTRDVTQEYEQTNLVINYRALSGMLRNVIAELKEGK